MDDLVETSFGIGMRQGSIVIEFDIERYCHRITVTEAAALRDWLNKALPAPKPGAEPI